MLLERIIEISTDVGDIVLDPFCGSGTTLVAAHLMGRKYIGIDKSFDAIALAKKRIDFPVRSNSQLMKIGKNAYETKTEYEKLLLKSLDADIVQRNKGVDAILRKQYNGGLVAIKIQKDKESTQLAVDLLLSSNKNKKYGYLILIRTILDCEQSTIKLPNNMLIVNCYKLVIQEYLESKDIMTNSLMALL